MIFYLELPLTFTITNISGNPAKQEINFTDKFPDKISIIYEDIPPGEDSDGDGYNDNYITNTCNGTLTDSSGATDGTETIGIGDTGITLKGGSLASGTVSCQISFKVTSNFDVNTPTPYLNDSSNIDDNNRNNICTQNCNNPNAGDLSATLTVNPFPVSPLAGSLIINEILYRGTGSSTASNSEFVELFNASASDINLAGLKLADGNLIATGNPNAVDENFINGAKFYTFGSGTNESGNLILKPGEYAVVWIGPNNPQNNPQNNAPEATFQAWLGQRPKLNNQGDDVWLYDADTKVIDYVAYGSNSINARPDPNSWSQWDSTYEDILDNASAEQSISLTPNGIDGNTSACWEATTSNEANNGDCSNFLTTIDTDKSAVDSNERITSVGRNNNAASLILVKRITNISPNPNSINFNTVVDDGVSNNEDDDPNWASNFLTGQISLEDVRPGDEIEYTIYFLSNGDRPINNVKLCDLVPDNMSFVENSFGSSRGINLFFDNTTETLSNNPNDTDRGKFINPDTDPPTFCKKMNSSGDLVTVARQDNKNGIVVVNIDDTLPPATNPGTPTDAYGFIRFRAKIK